MHAWMYVCTYICNIWSITVACTHTNIIDLFMHYDLFWFGYINMY